MIKLGDLTDRDLFFFFSSRRRHTRCGRDWSSDVCSSDLETIEQVIEQSGLIAHHQKEKGEKAQARIENLEELVSAARQFAAEEADLIEEEELPHLVQFLDRVALDSGDQQASEFEDAVQLMTLHAAKGLEFPQVVLAGLEEGLFPH